jgi:hypothetical protein
MSVRRLIFCAFPFGYGPAAKLLSIARAVRAHGIAPWFLGSGIALELVRRSAGIFDEVIEASASNAAARSLVSSSDGIVSSMDRRAAQLARESSRPLYIVDSLLWMRDRVPEAFLPARRYWAQRFFGEPIGSPHLPVARVGPIVSPFEPGPPLRRAELVVHLGGCESPWATPEDHYRYAAFVTRAVVSAGLPRDASCLVLSGASCTARLRAEFSACGVEFDSLSHEEALNALSQAAVVFTSPGVTATLECFRAGVATSFLPPQNYSQWMALEAVREAGLAPEALHWADVAVPPPFRRMPEDRRTPAVLETIARLSAEGSVRHELTCRLRAAARLPRPELGARQRAAFESLGANGAVEIASQLASESWCEGSDASQEARRGEQ